MSRADTLNGFIDVFYSNFIQLHQHYTRNFYSKWKFRRYCARQTAFDTITTELFKKSPPSPSPIVNDMKRRKCKRQRKRSRKKKRKKGESPEDPLKVRSVTARFSWLKCGCRNHLSLLSVLPPGATERGIHLSLSSPTSNIYPRKRSSSTPPSTALPSVAGFAMESSTKEK
jgi:hypothetical protein